MSFSLVSATYSADQLSPLKKADTLKKNLPSERTADDSDSDTENEMDNLAFIENRLFSDTDANLKNTTFQPTYCRYASGYWNISTPPPRRS